VKPTFPLIALLATAACGGTVSSGALAPDGGASCLQPTVMPLLVAPGQPGLSGFLEVALGDVAPGLDPVVLASVRLRAAPGLSLSFVDGALLSVRDASGGPSAVLAAGGTRDEDGLSMALPSEAELHALAPGGVLPISLELEGTPPAAATSVTLDVCVRPPSHYGVF
jgi:hypothetical protein